MPRYVAFLRAINVGGRTVRMEQLREIFAEAGCGGAETYQAAGNVIFTVRSRSESTLVARLERQLRATLGYEVATFLRSDREVSSIAGASPFSAREAAAAKALNVGLLRRPPSAGQIELLHGLESDLDSLRAVGREIWWLTRARQSESKLSNVRFERVLGLDATFRGLGTLRRLAERYPPRA